MNRLHVYVLLVGLVKIILGAKAHSLKQMPNNPSVPSEVEVFKACELLVSDYLDF